MDGRLVIGLAEIVALVVGIVCYYFGWIAWYVIPLFLLAPIVILAILAIAAFTAACRNGGNPFQ